MLQLACAIGGGGAVNQLQQLGVLQVGDGRIGVCALGRHARDPVLTVVELSLCNAEADG